MATDVKICARCNAVPEKNGERYCKDCRMIVLDELKEAGYLTPKPFSQTRSTEQMENTYETKHGTGHG